MNRIENSWKHIFLRAIVISGVGIMVGFMFYRDLIFIPTMRPFQFTESSITAGLAFAFWKSSTTRNVLAALFIWYIIATGLLVKFNWWLPILNFVYIGGIAAAIFFYNYVVKKQSVKQIILRIVLAGTFISLANGLILIFLRLFSFKATIDHFHTWLEWTIRNIELGAIIGIAIGIGIEVAEYLIGKFGSYLNGFADEE